jgi:hypothetical protein
MTGRFFPWMAIAARLNEWGRFSKGDIRNLFAFLIFGVEFKDMGFRDLHPARLPR